MPFPATKFGRGLAYTTQVTKEELKAKLLKPILLERSRGAQNNVVAGGLAKMMESLGSPFPELFDIFWDYDKQTPPEREASLGKAVRFLEPKTAKLEGIPEPKKQKPKNANELDESIDTLDFTTATKKKLKQLGLQTLRDVLHNYPRRHEDRRALLGINEIPEGQKATITATVLSKTSINTSRRGLQIVQVKLLDSKGSKFNAVWFNQPWVLKSFNEGSSLILSGRVSRVSGARSLQVEYFEDEGTESLSTGRIVPVYATKEGISQAIIRRTSNAALGLAKHFDMLEAYRQKLGLVPLEQALQQIHFPDDEEKLSAAMHRLKFDEFLLLELKVMIQSGTSSLRGRQFEILDKYIEDFRTTLGFSFTKAQERVLNEISADMKSDRQMARLLQGDVGSGKTAVAAAGLYVAAKNGAQGALMAPTEILAKQHFANLTRYLFPLGVTVDLLVGSMSAGEKREIVNRLKSGETQIVVGTHALIQDTVTFRDLAFAVIDEEHRFGVSQRRALLGSRPDVLVMSATPIPRSLALTMYGDLEVSILDELPPGRTPIKTKLLTSKNRSSAYAFAKKEISKGRQVFVVAPLIEEGTSEVTEDLAAATLLYEQLSGNFPELRIGLLHGRLPADEKDAVMEAFKNKLFDLLVSTTVIEVGVDIPNATLMIIENAERFGLAQLHQLRGRVGRGSEESFCILVAGDTSRKTISRLKVIEDSTDGFYIAEKDLALRGPGELRGFRQSGLPDLRLGDLVSDTEIIEQTRALAQSILALDPTLEQPQNINLKRELQARAEAIGFREVI